MSDENSTIITSPRTTNFSLELRLRTSSLQDKGSLYGCGIWPVKFQRKNKSWTFHVKIPISISSWKIRSGTTGLDCGNNSSCWPFGKGYLPPSSETRLHSPTCQPHPHPTAWFPWASAVTNCALRPCLWEVRISNLPKLLGKKKHLLPSSTSSCNTFFSSTYSTVWRNPKTHIHKCRRQHLSFQELKI